MKTNGQRPNIDDVMREMIDTSLPWQKLALLTFVSETIFEGDIQIFELDMQLHSTELSP